jgi:6-phosphogluconate dehydrogenase
MVHNGIEYGDIQLIAETYDILRRGFGMGNEELHQVFSQWNQGPLASYLIEIAADIFKHKDEETGEYVIDLILDAAGQKGTGKWTSQNALDLGIPTTTITEAVFARALSAHKEERVAAAKVLTGPDLHPAGDTDTFVPALEDALYASKVISYAQGFSLLRAASEEYGYDLNYGEIARIWRGGCIIRAQFLNDITAASQETPDLPNLLLAPYFREGVVERQQNWRTVVKLAITLGIPTPAMSASLAYFDGYRSARLPANLIQALRDYFGAHTYERIDKPRGEFFHTEWVQSVTDITAGTYNA